MSSYLRQCSRCICLFTGSNSLCKKCRMMKDFQESLKRICRTCCAEFYLPDNCSTMTQCQKCDFEEAKQNAIKRHEEENRQIQQRKRMAWKIAQEEEEKRRIEEANKPIPCCICGANVWNKENRICVECKKEGLIPNPEIPQNKNCPNSLKINNIEITELNRRLNALEEQIQWL